MTHKVYNVLFVCTGNSARSIMAEAVMNHQGRARFRAFSAGSRPAGQVNPLALEALRHYKLPTAGFRSKSWDEFARPDAPSLDFVLTVCDKAAGEECPLWPGQPITAMWGVPDPATFEGSHDEMLRVFIETLVVLKRRIDLMQALPLDKLDALSWQQQLQGIGKR